MQFLYQLFATLTYPIYTFLNSPMELLAAPKRLLGLSLPLRIAVLTFIFLVTCVITAFVTFLFQDSRAEWRNWFTQNPVRTIAIPILLFVIPTVIYWAIRWWLHQEASRFPDIDNAWRDGVAAMKAAGMELSETALFLITGVKDATQAENLMKASDLEILVKQTPSGPAALHWYATNRGIFLFATRCGRVSKLQTMSGIETPAARAQSPHTITPDDDVGRGTHVPGMGEGVGRGTMVGGPMEESFGDRPGPDYGGGGGGGGGFTGTMQFGGGGGFGGTMTFGGGGGMFNPLANTGPQLQVLNDADGKTESARLQYVCELLWEARQPYCPLNGLLSYLPFELIRHGNKQCMELQKAAAEDNRVLRESLKVRCPQVALVGNMELEPGFQELVRRIGKKAAKDQRFGKGFNQWTFPEDDQVLAVAAHACGAFEDWTYYLFKEKDGLSKTAGNKKLYSLLCKIRSQVREYFENLLAEVYGQDRQKFDENRDPQPFLFLGCYFGGTGPLEDQQAFVKSVFGKLCESEESLDWMPAALEEDAAYRKMANVAFTWATLMLLAIVVVLVFHNTRGKGVE